MSDIWGEAERIGVVKPGKKKALGGVLSMCVVNVMGNSKEDEPDFSQWCPRKGQEEMDTNYRTFH